MFRTEGAANFLAAWRELCRDEATPHFRTAFQQLSPKILPRIVILEKTPEVKYIIRFMGTARALIWGEDLTGKDFMLLMPDSMRTTANRNMTTMLDHPCGMSYVADYVTSSGRELLIEHITVPVDNDAGLPRRLLNYAEEVTTGDYVDPRGQVQAVSERQWIDIGAGLPAKPPVK